jgi:hypothetical protein
MQNQVALGNVPTGSSAFTAAGKCCYCTTAPARHHEILCARRRSRRYLQRKRETCAALIDFHIHVKRRVLKSLRFVAFDRAGQLERLPLGQQMRVGSGPSLIGFIE